MRTLALAVAAGALLAATHANAARMNHVTNDLVDQVAVRVYVHEGRRFCFYFDGWHGPGWYRCGFAFRRGLGWGGEYGWNGWGYGPAERRFGHRGGVEFGVRSGTDRDRTSIDTRSRSRTTTSGTSFDCGRRGRTGADVEMRGRTTGSGSGMSTQSGGSGANVQSGGSNGAKIQGGANTRGGGSLGSDSG